MFYLIDKYSITIREKIDENSTFECVLDPTTFKDLLCTLVGKASKRTVIKITDDINLNFIRNYPDDSFRLVISTTTRGFNSNYSSLYILIHRDLLIKLKEREVSPKNITINHSGLNNNYYMMKDEPIHPEAALHTFDLGEISSDFSRFLSIVPTKQQQIDINKLVTIEREMLGKRMISEMKDNKRYSSYTFHPFETSEKESDSIEMFIEVPTKLSDHYIIKDIYSTYEKIPNDNFSHSGIIITNSVGMGKTILSLGIMMQDYETKSQLVLVPNRLIDQWRESIETNTNLTVICIQNVPQFKKHHMKFKTGVIYLMTYNVIGSKNYNEISVFSHNWDRVFMDEIHEVYSNQNDMNQKILHDIYNVSTYGCMRYLITATPNVNSYKNSEAVIKLLLNDYKYYKHDFCERYFSTQAEFMNWLNKYIYASITNSDKDLNIFPDPIINKITVPMSHLEYYIDDQIKNQKHLIYENLQELSESNYSNVGYYQRVPHAQCKCKKEITLDCGHKICPKLFRSHFTNILCSECKTNTIAPKYNQYGSKFEAVLRRVIEIVGKDSSSENRLILSSNNKKLLKVYKTEIELLDISCGVLEGTVFKINKSVENFKKGEHKVLLIDLNSQSSGLELKEATHIIIADTHEGFDSTDTQIIGRACRTGQTKQVIVDIFVCEDSLESRLRNR